MHTSITERPPAQTPADPAAADNCRAWAGPRLPRAFAARYCRPDPDRPDQGRRAGLAGGRPGPGAVWPSWSRLAAAGLLEQALAIYQDTGNRRGEANAARDLGTARRLTGDYLAAAGLLKRSEALLRALGDAHGEAETLNVTGALLAESAGPQEALPVYRQALLPARQVGNPLDEAQAPEGAARCAAQAGDRAAARADLSQATAIYQRIGAAEGRAGRRAADGAGRRDPDCRQRAVNR